MPYSILDDKLLSERLAEQPEFRLRLVEFLLSYGVIDRAALIIQARPAHGSEHIGVNVYDADIQKRFLAGVKSNNGWWQGFRAMSAVRYTFHGIASLPARDEPAWASELHHDGHFIAGTWIFPQMTLQDSTVVEALADFYSQMFVDFLRLIESTVGQVDDQRSYQTTWTLVHAPKLYYVSQSMWGQRSITAQPLQISNLQWPISSAKIGTPEWTQLAIHMGQALMGAYGDAPRSGQ